MLWLIAQKYLTGSSEKQHFSSTSWQAERIAPDGELPSSFPLTHLPFTCKGSSNVNKQACFRKIPVTSCSPGHCDSTRMGQDRSVKNPSISTGKRSSLIASVLTEETSGIPGSQTVSEQHPQQQTTKLLFFTAFFFFFKFLLFFTLAFFLGRSLHLSFGVGAPCCWQPLEDAPRALWQQQVRVAWVGAKPPGPSPGAAPFSPMPSHTCRFILLCLRLPEAHFASLRRVVRRRRTSSVALNLCGARGEQEVIFRSEQNS